MNITIRPVGVEQASEVCRTMQWAFEEYRGRLVPPSGALAETVEDVRTAISGGGAFLAFAGDVVVGSARYRLFPGYAYAERIAVLPEHRRRGIAVALMAAVEAAGQALGAPDARVVPASAADACYYCWRKKTSTTPLCAACCGGSQM